MNTKFDLNDKVILKGRIDQITIDNDTNSNVVYIISVRTGDSNYPNHVRIEENMLFKMQDYQKPEQKTIDIVMCKDCKKDGTINCPFKVAKFGYTDWDFCSCGERKDNEVTAWDYPDGYFEMEKDDE